MIYRAPKIPATHLWLCAGLHLRGADIGRGPASANISLSKAATLRPLRFSRCTPPVSFIPHRQAPLLIEAFHRLHLHQSAPSDFARCVLLSLVNTSNRTLSQAPLWPRPGRVCTVCSHCWPLPMRACLRSPGQQLPWSLGNARGVLSGVLSSVLKQQSQSLRKGRPHGAPSPLY